MTEPALIGLDWGTSTLRGYVLTRGGTILERIERAQGILKVEDGDFEGVFAACVGPWRERLGDLPVLASGMIGARQGWREIPYAACPAGLDELAQGLVAVPNRAGTRLWFVPGVARTEPDDMPDVMRGEETQLMGAFAEGGDGIALLPGTHSKWARIEDGRLSWFATFMTGELFAVLEAHSILGRMMAGEGLDDDAFARGLAFGALEDPGKGGLLRRLFSARTLALFDRLSNQQVRGYLSGLLIGAELREAQACLGDLLAHMPVNVIGGAALAPRYAQALEALHSSATTRGEEVVGRGLAAIAARAGLLA